MPPAGLDEDAEREPIALRLGARPLRQARPFWRRAKSCARALVVAHPSRQPGLDGAVELRVPHIQVQIQALTPSAAHVPPLQLLRAGPAARVPCSAAARRGFTACRRLHERRHLALANSTSIAGGGASRTAKGAARLSATAGRTRSQRTRRMAARQHSDSSPNMNGRRRHNRARASRYADE